MDDFDPESAGVAPVAFDPESAGHPIGPVAVQPAAHEDPAMRSQWDRSGPIDKLRILMNNGMMRKITQDIPSVVGGVPVGIPFQGTKSVALNAGGASAGQAVGAMTGPFAPVAVPALGALGSAIGNTIDQFTRPGNEPFKFGELGSSALLGAIPGGSLAKASIPRIALAGAKFGAGSVAAKTVQTSIDESRMPTPGEAMIAFGAGAAAAPLAAWLSPGSNVASAEAKKALSSVRDATLRDARAAGYVVPSSKVNPSALNETAESFAGKAAMGQEAALRNQDVTNELARKSIGLPSDQAITPQAIDGVRDSASQAYRDVAALNPQAAMDLELLKKARFEKSQQYAYYQRSANPEALEKAKVADALAEKLETQLEQAAKQAGKMDLVKNLMDARRTIAKTYVVENALNAADGNVSAAAIGRQFDKGKPLTDELATIGRFQQAFPAYARDGASIPAAGVSKLKAVASPLLAAAGLHGAGLPGAAIGAALPFTDSAARSALLSRFYQNSRFAQPAYNQSRPDIQELLARFAAQNAGQQSPDSLQQFLSPQPQN